MASASDAIRERKRPRTASAKEERTSKRRGGGGGIYAPPHRAAADDGYERRSWDALRRSITALVNKATAANIRHVAAELLEEDLARGRGLLCRALLKSQAAACPAFTPVFAALAAAANAVLPDIGRLLLVRLALRLRRAHAAAGGGGDRHQMAAAAGFVAHLVNQGVAHDVMALEILALLLDRPTDGTVEVAVGLVTECGAALGESCPRGLDAVFDSLRSILHDGDVDTRTQFLIEDLFAVRKSKFRSHPPLRPELDLVEHDDQVTHLIELGDKLDPEDHLDVFKPSPSFAQDEAAYQQLKRAMFGDDDENKNNQSSSADETEGSEDEESDVEEATIHDETDTDLTNLRRTIYLTVMSSADSDEAGHKLLSVVRPGQEAELCAMLVECCRKEKACNTGFYGRIGQGLCAIDRAYQAGFEACFAGHYAAVHRMATDELRATAGFFAGMLAAGALPWRGVLGRVRVTEEDTTSSSRIFIKVLFQDLGEQLGIRTLAKKMNDEDDEVRDALFPRDCARNTRFAINFFTAIGLGGVTESARKLIAKY
ncbi:unnamed protein product [Urochloa humidicola]